MNIAYEKINFSKSSLLIIEQANDIIDDYQAQGFTLTLRQLYYQFVSRDLIVNTIQSYKRLGSIINDARMAGMISWYAIEDRTRNLMSLSHWETPREIMAAVVDQFRVNKWANQPYRPEVWIEKDALTGVIAGVCNDLDAPYFACRGYNSQSEQWSAGQRFARYADNGQAPIVFHLGDHDPSGIDMTRDNQDRLSLFAGVEVTVKRLALNYDQIKKYAPPPNPAKTTDSRYYGYIRAYGKQSWELDALEPRILSDLVKNAILSIRDDDAWARSIMEEHDGRSALRNAMDAL
ncbi:MAG TPA: hypothetical protein PK600_01505 [Deltaproteobacteria bacterium]|nr:hypothetical protein [Deltaproteobacteria bacterium]